MQGIKVLDASTVVGNSVTYSGGVNIAGIWCAGDRSVIDGNSSFDNGYGVFVSGTNNLIVRNTAAGSDTSNFYIVAGNRVGLITAGNTNAALINGSSGGGLGFTDPNANVAY